MKRALIFGASGQDGAYLSRLLLERGYEVQSRDDLSTIRNLAGMSELSDEELEGVSGGELELNRWWP